MDDRRRKEFDAAADRLFGATGRVSLRTVIPLLRKGGSNRDYGPELKRWKAVRGYRPALKARELPVPLQAALAKVAGELWSEAQGEAAAALARDRENMAVERQAGEDVLAEALGRLDAAEETIADLRAQVARLEARLDRGRAEEFWDRVMREVYEILPETGDMGVSEILPLVRPETVRGAIDHREPLTVQILRKKMLGRIEQGWYFTKGDKGRFARGRYPTLARPTVAGDRRRS